MSYRDEDQAAHVAYETRSEKPRNGERVRVTWPGDAFEGEIVWCDRSGAYVRAPDGVIPFALWHDIERIESQSQRGS